MEVARVGYLTDVRGSFGCGSFDRSTLHKKRIGESLCTQWENLYL